MKTKFLITMMVLVATLLILNSCRGPKIQTYSIEGEIEFVNDCSGNGADNPKEIEIVARLWYAGIGVMPDMTKRTKFKMQLQADGVTSKGKFKFKDVPTNLRGKKWTLTFPDLCSKIPCESPATCQNMATNPRMPIRITGSKTTYNYRYYCTCMN